MRWILIINVYKENILRDLKYQQGNRITIQGYVEIALTPPLSIYLINQNN